MRYDTQDMRNFRLSKSKIISGLQCSKRLWLETHHREYGAFSEQTQFMFASGNRVGEVARDLYPGGVLIESQRNLSAALRQTEDLLAGSGDVVLFEPAFRHLDVLIRADILVRAGGSTRLVEVKSATSVKEYHLTDAAVQAWVVVGSGQAVDGFAVAHIDSDFVYPGSGDYRGLLREVAVDVEIDARIGAIAGTVTGLRAMLANPIPAITTGAHCRQPFECPFMAWCTARETAASGLFAAPEPVFAPSRDYLDEAAAAEALAGLGWPLFYLDFETVQFAVPVWAGTRPYEQLPFQWSCHVESSAAEIEHREFLDLSGDPPMRAFSESLLAALGDSGPVFVYSSFEASRLRELAARYPDLADGLEALCARLVDLLPVVRTAYAHPGLNGSLSLKAVLPTIAPDLDYEQLGEIRDGLRAQQAYLEALGLIGEESGIRREELRTGLIAYCAQDTLALVRLLGFLRGAD